MAAVAWGLRLQPSSEFSACHPSLQRSRMCLVRFQVVGRGFRSRGLRAIQSATLHVAHRTVG